MSTPLAGRMGRAAAALLLAGAAAACTPTPDPPPLDWDPHERANRAVHAFNVEVDRMAWGPAARGYGAAVPQPVRAGIANLRSHWRLPHHTLHYALQGRGERAVQSAVRFVANTILGVGGLFDPAGAGGLPYRLTNVDETLFVWGVREGGYLEIPLGGPGTERDWAGWVLDFATDPMTFLAPAEALNALLAVGALDIVNDRYVLDPVLEALLYESADSYTALRISYLQNMRARLQDGVDLDALEDVYDF